MGGLIEVLVMAGVGVGILVVLGIMIDLGMRRDSRKAREKNGDGPERSRWD